MVEVGFTPTDLVAAGFDPETVVDAASTAGGDQSAQLASLVNVPGITAKLLKETGGYSANDLRSYGISAGALSAAGFSAAEVEASAAYAPTTSTTPIIIAALAVLVVVIVAAAIVVKKRSGNNDGADGIVAFENPMYDSVHGSNASGPAYADPNSINNGNGTTGYMDVPAGGGGFGGGGDGDGGGGGGSGYMDVSPNTVAVGGGAVQTSGYMDVGGADQRNDGFEESDEEEV